jgi:predicted flap endonuclease-1-like 5' DNA nuclease
MSADITLLRSVTEEIANRLRQAGLHHPTSLIAATSSLERCRATAERTGIDLQTLSRLGRKAELMLIRGIGIVYVDLLDHLDVRSVADLAASSTESLYARMHAVEDTRIAWRLPSRSDLDRWIQQGQAQYTGVNAMQPGNARLAGVTNTANLD